MKMLRLPRDKSAWVWVSLGVDALCIGVGCCLTLFVIGRGPELYSIIGAALGALFAVSGAVLVAQMQSAEKSLQHRNDVERKALAIAILIRPQILAWVDRFDGTIIPTPSQYSNGAEIGAAIHLIRLKYPFVVPKLIFGEISRLWTMGEAGQYLLQCISRSDELDRLSTAVFELRHVPLGDESLVAMSERFFRKYMLQVKDLAAVAKHVAHVLDR